MEMRMSGMPENYRESNSDSGILTMAFVNMQPFDEVYKLCEGFTNGTIFPNLNKPFMPGGMNR